MEQVLGAYRDAAAAKDVERFVALYDDDVRVFDLWGRWSYEGRAAWRVAVAEWFASLGGERVEVAFSDVVEARGDALASLSAIVTYTNVPAADTATRSMDNRLTWVLRRTDDRWLIVHEHTSAPVEPSTLSATLRR